MVWHKICFCYCAGVKTLVFGDDFWVLVFCFYWLRVPLVEHVFNLFVEVCI